MQFRGCIGQSVMFPIDCDCFFVPHALKSITKMRFMARYGADVYQSLSDP